MEPILEVAFSTFPADPAPVFNEITPWLKTWDFTRSSRKSDLENFEAGEFLAVLHNEYRRFDPTYEGRTIPGAPYLSTRHVAHEGSVYRANGDTSTEPGTDASWVLVGAPYLGAWIPYDPDEYSENDVVSHSGSFWRADVDAVAGEPGVDGDWIEIEEWVPVFDSYSIGDVVLHSSYWISTTNGNTGEPGVSGDWTLIIDWFGDFPSYVNGDVVTWSSSVWILVDDSGSGGEEPGTGDDWSEIFPPGWTQPSGSPYGSGIYVEWDSAVYLSNTSTSQEPGTGGDWDLVSTSVWSAPSPTGEYDTDDIVSNGGSGWVANAPNQDEVPGSGSSWDELTLWEGTWVAPSGTFVPAPYTPDVKPHRRLRMRYRMGHGTTGNEVTNRVNNGAFAQGDIAWVHGGNRTVTITGGEASASSGNLASKTATIQSERFHVNKRLYRYDITAQFKASPTTDPQHCSLQIQWYDETDTLISTSYPDATLSGVTSALAGFDVGSSSYARYGGLFLNVPDDAFYARVFIYLLNNPSTGSDRGSKVKEIQVRAIGINEAVAGMAPLTYENTTYYDAWCGEYGGYVDEWPQEWPDRLLVGECAVTATDAFKAYSMNKFQSWPDYSDLIGFHDPVIYLRLNEKYPAETLKNEGSAGGEGKLTPIPPSDRYRIIGMIDGDLSRSIRIISGDLTDLTCVGPSTPFTQMSIDFWIRRNNAGNATLFTIGADLLVQVNTNKIRFNIGATVLTGTTTISTGVDYHVTCTYDGANMKIYVDGVLEATTAKTGAVTGTGLGGGPLDDIFDEIAVFDKALTATDIASIHESASKGRRQEDFEDRMDFLFSSVPGVAPIFTIQTGVRDIEGFRFKGQSYLGEIFAAAQAQGGPFFIDKAGIPTALASDWKTSYTPAASSQATFADGFTFESGNFLYLDTKVNYDDSYLYNVVEGSRLDSDGTSTRVIDQDSIDEYDERSLSFPGLYVVSDSDLEDVVEMYLARYKDPMLRITSLKVTPDMDETGNLRHKVGLLDTAHEVTVKRNPGGVGDDIVQVSHIETVRHSGDMETGAWEVEYEVSPR